MRQKIKLIIALSITMLAAIFSIFVFNPQVYASSDDKIIGYNTKIQYGYYTRSYRISTASMLPNQGSYGNTQYTISSGTGTFYLHDSTQKNCNLQSVSNYYDNDTNNRWDDFPGQTRAGFIKILKENIENSSDGTSGIKCYDYNSYTPDGMIYTLKELGSDISKWTNYYQGNGYYYNCWKVSSYDYNWERVYLSGSVSTSYTWRQYSYSVTDSDVTWYDTEQSHDESDLIFSLTSASNTTYKKTRFYSSLFFYTCFR